MYKFDAMKVKNEIVEWIRDWIENNGSESKVVIGISGGKDSSVVASLCVEALGKDRVVGVLMPRGKQSDINYSKELVEFLGIKSYEVNIGGVADLFVDNLGEVMNTELSDQTKINLPARLRMCTLYAIAQTVGGRVANTCNLSETMLGYETRWGDAVGDFAPIVNLTVQEVKEIGKVLGLPIKLIEKTPSDGLCGLSDEDNFGFTYAVLDKYLRDGVIEDVETQIKIESMIQNSEFKRLPISSFIPEFYINCNLD